MPADHAPDGRGASGFGHIGLSASRLQPRRRLLRASILLAGCILSTHAAWPAASKITQECLAIDTKTSAKADDCRHAQAIPDGERDVVQEAPAPVPENGSSGRQNRIREFFIIFLHMLRNPR
jgi:hypothetical protein